MRAVVDFIVRHPNITGGTTFHTWSGVLLRPFEHLSDDEMDAEDLWFYQAAGRKGTELTGYPAISVYHEFRYHPKSVIGGTFDWIYEHLGTFSWVVEIWSPMREAGIADYKFIDSAVTERLALRPGARQRGVGLQGARQVVGRRSGAPPAPARRSPATRGSVSASIPAIRSTCCTTEAAPGPASRSGRARRPAGHVGGVDGEVGRRLGHAERGERAGHRGRVPGGLGRQRVQLPGEQLQPRGQRAGV